MPYHYILANLLADNQGATAVLFLDDTGEAIAMACADPDPEEMRILGAYLGIYLRHLERVAVDGGLGEPRLIHIERGGLNVYTMPLADGYHVALVQRQPALVGQARRRLEAAAVQLSRWVLGSDSA
jgi:predicted regulator of Ras-like GTPase activity (Roadblock/LC7/MglB family)